MNNEDKKQIEVKSPRELTEKEKLFALRYINNHFYGNYPFNVMEEITNRQELINVLKEEFKKKFNKVNVIGKYTGETGKIKSIRINQETDDLEYELDWYNIGWRKYSPDLKREEAMIIRVLCKVLGIKILTHYIYEGEDIFTEHVKL